MKTRFIITKSNNILLKLSFLILLINNTIQAQDSLNRHVFYHFIGLEAAINTQFPKAPEYDFIRGDILPYSSGSVSETLSAGLSKNQFGIKAEFRNHSNRWGLLFGLYYSKMKTNLGKRNFYSSGSKYFYLLDNQTGTTTEYYRIKNIDRQIDYLGIPLEFRWLSKSSKNIKLYLKLGFAFDLKINSTSDVEFYNADMLEYQDVVMNKFAQIKPFYSATYFATGLNFCKKPDIDLEFIFPYFAFTPKATGIVESKIGTGLKLEIRLPY